MGRPKMERLKNTANIGKTLYPQAGCILLKLVTGGEVGFEPAAFSGCADMS